MEKAAEDAVAASAERVQKEVLPEDGKRVRATMKQNYTPKEAGDMHRAIGRNESVYLLKKVSSTLSQVSYRGNVCFVPTDYLIIEGEEQPVEKEKEPEKEPEKEKEPENPVVPEENDDIPPPPPEEEDENEKKNDEPEPKPEPVVVVQPAVDTAAIDGLKSDIASLKDELAAQDKKHNEEMEAQKKAFADEMEEKEKQHKEEMENAEKKHQEEMEGVRAEMKDLEKANKDSAEAIQKLLETVSQLKEQIKTIEAKQLKDEEEEEEQKKSLVKDFASIRSALDDEGLARRNGEVRVAKLQALIMVQQAESQEPEHDNSFVDLTV